MSTEEEEIKIPVNQLQRKSITPITPLKSHSCTDVICLLFFIVFLIGWLFISIYAFKEGDLQQGLESIYSKASKYGIDLDVQNNLVEKVGNLNPLQVPIQQFKGVKEILDKNNVVAMMFGDIQKSYGKISFVLLLSMVACLMLLYLLRWLAGPVIWLSIVGSIASLGFGTYYSYFKYTELKSKIGVTQLKGSVVSLINVRAMLKQILDSKAMWFWLLMISGVGFLVILSITAILRKRISSAIVIIKEGSKAVSSIKMTVFLPFLLMVFKVLVLIYGIFVALELESVGMRNIKVAGDLVFFKVYNVVGLFWVIIFITTFGEMVLGATFATWYWTFHKAEVSYYTVITGISQTVFYHLGTIAFGSLITTICQINKVLLFILDYIEQPLKPNNNEVVRVTMCTSKYLFWCFEEFIKFINKNAYIMCALHGKNFCLSTRSAFNLVLRNYIWALNMSSVTNIVFFLYKILLSVGMGNLTYLYFSFNEFHLGNLTPERPVEVSQLLENQLQLQLIEVPIFLVGIGTYIIATLFFKVYSMAIDTIFVCFLEDFKINDGSAEKPYFMSKELMKILKK